MDQKPETKWDFCVFAVRGIEQKKIFKGYVKETYINVVVETWLKNLDISF